jgi:hypothetical protein
MTDKPNTLSHTARRLLTAAANRRDLLLQVPELPIAAARQVLRSLLNSGLAEKISSSDADPGYAMETSPVSDARGGDVARRTTESPAATSTTA